MATIEPCTSCVRCFETAWALERARAEYRRSSSMLASARRVAGQYNTFAPPPPICRQWELSVGACLNNLSYHQRVYEQHRLGCTCA